MQAQLDTKMNQHDAIYTTVGNYFLILVCSPTPLLFRLSRKNLLICLFCFLQQARRLGIYSDFICNYENAVQTLHTLRKKPEVAQFLQVHT